MQATNVRVLLLVSEPSVGVRHVPIVRALAARGHSVVVGYDSSGQGLDVLRALAAECPLVQLRRNPTRLRNDRWLPFVVWLRQFQDFLLYFEDRYGTKHGARLRGKAERYLTARARAVTKHVFLLTGRPGIRAIRALMRALDLAIAPPADFARFIQQAQPDVVLLGSLTDYASRHVDYVKAVSAIGTPAAMLVRYADELTNQGTVHMAPRHVIVATDEQKSNLATLHRVAASRVAVIGEATIDGQAMPDPERVTAMAETLAAVGVRRRPRFRVRLRPVLWLTARWSHALQLDPEPDPSKPAPPPQADGKPPESVQLTVTKGQDPNPAPTWLQRLVVTGRLQRPGETPRHVETTPAQARGVHSVPAPVEPPTPSSEREITPSQIQQSQLEEPKNKPPKIKPPKVKPPKIKPPKPPRIKPPKIKVAHVEQGNTKLLERMAKRELKITARLAERAAEQVKERAAASAAKAAAREAENAAKTAEREAKASQRAERAALIRAKRRRAGLRAVVHELDHRNEWLQKHLRRVSGSFARGRELLQRDLRLTRDQTHKRWKRARRATRRLRDHVRHGVRAVWRRLKLLGSSKKARKVGRRVRALPSQIRQRLPLPMVTRGIRVTTVSPPPAGLQNPQPEVTVVPPAQRVDVDPADRRQMH